MEKSLCEKCKNYFEWEDIGVEPNGSGLFVKKAVVNEVCCKVNRDIAKIKKCNSYEETEKRMGEVKEEEVEKEIIEKEDKKEVKKKKGRFVK